MIKKNIKAFFNKLGLNVSRYYPKENDRRNNSTQKSQRTDSLTYYETKTGNYYLPTHAYEDVVANAIIKNKVFEQEVVDLALMQIKEDTYVLDLGANFGQMSILFSAKVGETGRVLSFEADDFIFEILKKNIEANSKENIVLPIFGAVHNKINETLYYPEQDFIKYGAYGAYGINYNTNEGRQVPSITIDSLEIKEPISFMKIDIQGGDLLAMQGAVNTIRKNQMPILFEYEYHFEEEYNLNFQEYVDFVREIGYVFKKVINGHNYLIVPKN